MFKLKVITVVSCFNAIVVWIPLISIYHNPILTRLQRDFLWSGIGVKIKVAFHCTGLAFYAVLFQFNVALVAFSCSVAN